MHTKNEIRDHVTSLLVLLLLLGVSAVTPAQAADQMSVMLTSVRQMDGKSIEALVSVRDAQGRTLPDLSAANFTALLDREGAPVAGAQPFAAAGRGLAVVLCLDISGSMAGEKIEQARQAAASFVDLLNPLDVASVMTFGDTVEELIPFTGDHQKLKTVLLGIQATAQGTHLYQAFYDGASHAAVAPTDQAALVVLTDGKDETSGITLEDAVSRVVWAKTPVFAIAFGDKVAEEPLRRVSAISRGRFLRAPQAQDLAQCYTAIAESLRDQYLVKILPRAATLGQHTVTLRVTYRGLTQEDARSLQFNETRAATGPPGAGATSSAGTVLPPTSWLAWGGVALLVVLAAVFVTRARTRRSAAAERKCAWCGAPAEGPSSTYCAACAAKAAEGDKAPPEVALPTRLVWLDLLTGPRAGERIPLGEAGLKIGRGQPPEHDNDLALAEDEEISREHARLSLGPRGFYEITDNASRNGVFVNEHQVDHAALKNGDRIRLGATEMAFADHRPTEQPA